MSSAAVEWEVFQDALKEVEDAMEMLKADAHGVRHRDRSQAVKQAVATALQQAKAVESAIADMRQADERSVWKRKLMNGRKEVKELQRAAAEIDGVSAKKDALFAGAAQPNSDDPEDPRARVEATSRLLHGQNRSVQRSEMIALETERIGQDTLGTLRGNRETMLRTIDRTEDLRTETTRSRAVITNIKRVMVYGKLTQILIIAVLSLAILLVVYFRWLHTSSGPAPAPAPPAPPSTPTPSS
eukprot:TRINITY_DN19715_c0_g2_i1.p2 TRINITY_DN19715_c0_g2~~TRINITY_DN19715_c0_g2_i1.p2  ORF type:complete len:242 (+),score=88.35 TRINITY_DN19715_c0_g2_i1:93-818(+)